MVMDTVITGLGAVTPVGADVETTWQALLAGSSGIGPITRFDASGLPTRIAGEIKDFDPLAVMDAKQARRSARFSQLAVAAAVEALHDSRVPLGDDGLVPAGLSDRAGIVINTAVAGMGEIATAENARQASGWRSVGPTFVPSVIPNMPACQAAIRLGIHGPVTSSALACASGNAAVLEAARLIAAGEADLVLAGGTDASISPVMFAGLSAMGALSRRNNDPQAACRPFDADRDGFVYGEGAVVLVVESANHAAARGAHVYARVLGGALTSDAFHIAAPHPEGRYAAAALRQALQRSDLQPSEVDYICAHGTGTRANDRTETHALHQVLGSAAPSIPTSSPKSMVGHLIGSAGALSAMVCALAIRDHLVPPTINLQTPDPECDLDYVPNEYRPVGVEVALANAFGFGGQNCVLALGAP